MCHSRLANSKGKWGGWHIRDMVRFLVSAPHYAPPRIPKVLLGDFAGLWGSAALADPWARIPCRIWTNWETVLRRVARTRGS